MYRLRVDFCRRIRKASIEMDLVKINKMLIDMLERT